MGVLKVIMINIVLSRLADYQIKRSCITPDDEAVIKQLGTLYRINAIDMQGLVKDCLQMIN